MRAIAFEMPWVLVAGVPIAAAVMALAVRHQLRGGLGWRAIAASAGLRGAALLALLVLAARPVWVSTGARERAKQSRKVILLVDRSSSMALQDGQSTRAGQLNAFAAEKLAPALENAGLTAETYLFAEDAARADAAQVPVVKANGKRTDLGGAITRVMAASARPPLAVIALTDGAANEHSQDGRGLAALVEGQVPFAGVGFGSETRVRTLALTQAVAPSTVPPNQTFQLSAQLEMSSDETMPPFDLLLLRNGRMVGKRRIRAGKGQRAWLESFRLKEAAEGPHTYALQLSPPALEGLRCLDRTATANVRVMAEKRFRVLFAEGALSWDYKFIRLALDKDPSLHLTGLVRTSNQSYFHQGVENASELRGGFPSSVSGLSPFRVVVISSFGPEDLSAGQQDALKRFCSEYGGGVLFVGGTETFSPAWESSALAPLLPVTMEAGFDGAAPCRFQPAPEALQMPLFEIGGRGRAREVWARLPLFSRFARAGKVRQGALPLAVHPDERGADGRPRVLMAEQRYGAGLSMALCVGDFWRWRLARESDPEQFDRFWRQVLRHLGDQGERQIVLRLPDQDLRPQAEVRVSVERPRDPSRQTGRDTFRLTVTHPTAGKVEERALQLAAGETVDVTFRAAAVGVYTVVVAGQDGGTAACRPIEIRDTNMEYRHAGRSMETLAYWASLTGGVAVKAEECRDAGALIARIRASTPPPVPRSSRPPAGLSFWTLAVILGCLSAEWMLRKRWGMP